jgi:hypothetical protein
LYFNFTQINSFFILCIDLYVVCVQPTRMLPKLPVPSGRLCRPDLPHSSRGRWRNIKFNFWFNLNLSHMLFDLTDASQLSYDLTNAIGIQNESWSHFTPTWHHQIMLNIETSVQSLALSCRNGVEPYCSQSMDIVPSRQTDGHDKIINGWFSMFYKILAKQLQRYWHKVVLANTVLIINKPHNSPF